MVKMNSTIVGDELNNLHNNNDGNGINGQGKLKQLKSKKVQSRLSTTKKLLKKLHGSNRDIELKYPSKPIK